MAKRYRLKHSGLTVTLSSKPFAGGGEGNLYTITSPSNLRSYVAKIYHPHKLSKEREQKMSYLAQYPPINTEENADAHPSVVWVKDALYDQNKFVGFIMPYTNGEKLEILCTPKIPRKLRSEWKRFDFKQSSNALDFRLKLCFNICAAIHQVHAANRYVLVDMKPDNIIIQPNGLVSIVDTDSVEVVEDGKSLFDAPVATPEYTPPEHYQDLDYDPTEREEWDRFGLGVILYKLLFGIHPFAASSGPPYEHLVSLDDKIKHGLFVHHPAKRNSFKIIPPPHKGFNKLDPSLQALFMRCFIDGHQDPELRPSSEEWCATILLALDDEAAYQRYGHILGGAQLTTKPRFVRPSSRIALPQTSEDVHNIIALNNEATVPKPVVREPRDQDLKSFKVASLTTSEKVVGGIAIGLSVVTGAFVIAMIIGLFLTNRGYKRYKEDQNYREKEALEEDLALLKKIYFEKRKQVIREQRNFRRSVRRVIPKVERIAEKIKKEVETIKTYLKEQDQKVADLERQALEQYHLLNNKYVAQAEGNRAIARVKDKKHDTLSKIRIAINQSHKEAVDTLTKKHPINDQHPVMQKGKIAVDSLVKEKRIEIGNLIGDKTTVLQEKQDKELAKLYQKVKDDADLITNMHRLWRGRGEPSFKLQMKVKTLLKEHGFTSVTDIYNLNTRFGWITLRNGKKLSVEEFPYHKTVLKNLKYWFDETKHQLTNYSTQKAKIKKSYRTKINLLKEEQKMSLKNLEKLEREALQEVKVRAQKVVLGKPFEALQQDYETVTEFVNELEDAYVKEEEVVLRDYKEMHEEILQEAQQKTVETEGRIAKLEKELSKYSAKIQHPKVQKRYKELEKELKRLKNLLPRLEQKEFEYQKYKNINFRTYLNTLLERTT